MLRFVVSNWRVLGGLLLIIFSYLYGYDSGRTDMRRNWDAAVLKEKTNAAERTQKAELERIKKMAELKETALNNDQARKEDYAKNPHYSDCKLSADGVRNWNLLLSGTSTSSSRED